MNSTLFEWLTELYPVWARINADSRRRRGHAPDWPGSPGPAAPPPPTTTTSSRGARGDLLASTVDAAARIGLRFHPTRGSMDLGQSQGGLPPDSVVETIDEILRASHDAVERFHDPTPGAMVRVALAPCSPFSVSADLLTESAKLARSLGVRLHTHLAETLDEEEYCRDRHGCTPVEYLDQLGWLGDDVWLAHAVHLAPPRSPGSPRPARVWPTARPPTPGWARARRRAGRSSTPGSRSGSAWTGPPPRRRAGWSTSCARRSMPPGPVWTVASSPDRQRSPPGRRWRWPRSAGARCLGRADEIGSLEVGKLADLALWRMDGLGHVGIADPVDALVIGSAPPLELLTVGGAVVVERDVLVTADEPSIAAICGAPVRRYGHDGHRDPTVGDQGSGRRRGEPGPARRHAQGQGRVRLLLGSVARRGPVRRDTALAAPTCPDHRHRHLAGARRTWRLRRAHPRGRARQQVLRPRPRRPAGARHRRGPLPGRAGGDPGRERPAHGTPGASTGSRFRTRCCRR